MFDPEKMLPASNALGNDAKHIMLFCLGQEKQDSERIFRDFRGDYATEEIFIFAGNDLSLSDKFWYLSDKHWEKILAYLSASSPYFEQHIDKLIDSINQNIFAAVPALPLIWDRAENLSDDQLLALCNSMKGTATTRLDIIKKALKSRHDFRKLAPRLGEKLALLRNDTDGYPPDYSAKEIASCFMESCKHDSEAQDLFSNALFPADGGKTESPKTGAENRKRYFKTISTLSPSRSRTMLLKMFYEKDRQAALAHGYHADPIFPDQEFSDDIFHMDAEKAIKTAIEIAKGQPELEEPALENIRYIIEKENNYPGLYQTLVLQSNAVTPLSRKLLEMVCHQSNIRYSDVSLLPYLADKFPEMEPIFTSAVKRGLRNEAITDQPYSNLVANTINPFNFTQRINSQIIYTYLNDTQATSGQILKFSTEMFSKIRADDNNREHIWNMVRTIHNNQSLRKSPKDFSAFMGHLASYNIINMPCGGKLSSKIGKLIAKTDFKQDAYIQTLLDDSLKYHRNHQVSKTYSNGRLDEYLDNPDIVCQPAQHQKETLKNVQQVIEQNKLSLKQRTNIFLYLRRFEHHAISEVKDQCAEVENALKLPKLYTKMVEYGKNKALMINKVKSYVSKYF